MSQKRLLHRDSVKGHRASPGKAPETVANPDTVTLTASAVSEIRRQGKLQDSPPTAIRVGLRGGGCSGYTYTFEWEQKQAREKDIVIREDDVVVFIDHRSMKLLKGTILDYHRTMMSQGFKFHNPNSSGNCGCGESTSF
ncbi:MAG: iron-sulfur cluster assembly accessory protein [Kofleriaceae bacterium]|nr:iron-sulfur cluster assembly accessory protein [Kofleriaceae bacterium]